MMEKQARGNGWDSPIGYKPAEWPPLVIGEQGIDR